MERAEWTVYDESVRASRFGAILNEKYIVPAKRVKLPRPVRAVIAPAAWESRNEHPDVRLARRAQTIASLARVASERDVSHGLRRTLRVQAERLLYLATERYNALGGDERWGSNAEEGE
jgi:hypothetical protein